MYTQLYFGPISDFFRFLGNLLVYWSLENLAEFDLAGLGSGFEMNKF